jgi:integrase
MKAAITVDFVRRLPEGPVDVWDSKLTGLVLRISSSGRASWAVVYGRSKKLTLGRVDALTPLEARELAQQVLGDVARGIDPMAAKRRRQASSLDTFLEQQYEPWASTHRRTGADTVARVRAAFGQAFCNRSLSEISAWSLEQWRTARRRAHISDSTINRDLDALRAVLTKALEWKVIDAHPMRDVKRAKLDVLGRLRYLTPDEEDRLRTALQLRDVSRRHGRERFNAWRFERGYKTLPPFGAYPDHVTPIVLLALNTGLRRGELLALKWTDVDVVGRRLAVRGAAAKSGITRHIPLNDEALQLLREWQPCCSSEVLVFPGPDGNRMTSLKTSWLKIIKAAKLEDFTFHDLRHTFASKLVMAGVDLNTVRELLGHANITMTLRYSHLAPEHKAAAVAKLVKRS